MQKPALSPILEFIMIDLKGKNLVYVTRDIERALGFQSDTEGYHIISNSTVYAKSVKGDKTNVLLVEAGRQLDTWELLEDSKVLAYLGSIIDPHIVVFKNTPKIEQICRKRGLVLLNPSAELSNKIEEKISQVEWLGELARYLPKHRVALCKDVAWDDKPFILQFNRAHTGSGTLFISTESKLEELKKTFPDRPVRVTEFISAPSYTVNVVVDKKGMVKISSPSFQITGLSPFTDQPFATVGNDWSLARKLLSETAREKISEIANAVAKKMHTSGWTGLFGIDYLVLGNEVYLMEINARQPASVSYESQLQKDHTTFEAHTRALMGESLDNFSLTEVKQGAQIILRNVENCKYDIDGLREKIEKLGPHVITYENTKAGTDLLRIQSAEGLMQDLAEPCELLATIIKLIGDGGTIASAEIKSVHKNTLELIETYSGLQIAGHCIQCPYFNNKRARLRGALRPLIGKGTSEEIIEETEILAMKEKINLAEISDDAVKKFLVDHNLGIDCSGFVFYLLEAELAARKNISLKNKIRFEPIWNPLRLLIRKLRVVENINVQVLASEKNSLSLSLLDIKPGDIIVILNSGLDSARDHVLFVEKVEYEKNIPSKIHYVHSFQWSTDGKYNHGVRRGEITISNPSETIVDQKWIEQNVEGEKNETWRRTRGAKRVEIRRLVVL